MELQFTKDNGEIVSLEYLRRRVSAGLSRFRRWHSLGARRAAMRETVENTDWLRCHNHQTVGSVVRAVQDHLI